MHVKAKSTPASAPGGHTWEDPSDIVEVPDHLGNELIRIAGQFSEVLPTDPEHPHNSEPTRRGCAKDGCKSIPKLGHDWCRWHEPKTEISE